MRRILLVIEDFNELLYLQTILRKVGFDIEGVSQAKKFDDILLGFNPQAVILAPRIGKVNAADILSQIGKSNGFPKVGLLHNAKINIEKRPLQNAGVDFFISTPVNVHQLVETLASVLELDKEILQGKLKKLDTRDKSESLNSAKNSGDAEGGAEEDSDLITVKGKRNEGVGYDIISDQSHTRKEGSSSSIQTEDIENLVTEEQSKARKERNQEFMAKMEPVDDSHFIRDRILEFNKWIRSQPKPDDIHEIESDRKSFVKSLFNFKKSDSE